MLTHVKLQVNVLLHTAMNQDFILKDKKWHIDLNPKLALWSWSPILILYLSNDRLHKEKQMLQVISPCRWFRQPWKQHTYSFRFCLSLRRIIPQRWKRLSWTEMLITVRMNSLQVYTLNWQVCLNYTSLKLNSVLRKCQIWFICKLKTTKSLRPRQPITSSPLYQNPISTTPENSLF